jgi:hypothetical protein
MAPGHGRQGRWRVWVRAGSATPRLYLDASFVINTAPMFIVRGLGDSLNGRRAAEAGEVECLQSSRDRLPIRAEVHHFYLGSHSPIQDVLAREYVGGEGLESNGEVAQVLRAGDADDAHVGLGPTKLGGKSL